MPQRTRQIAKILATKYLPDGWDAIAIYRLDKGLSTYGERNHLKTSHDTNCVHCNNELPQHGNFCPFCGKDITPYIVNIEIGEEICDALNQAAIALRRNDWPEWKVNIVSKLCGILLHIIDTQNADAVSNYIEMIDTLPTAKEALK